MISEEEKEEIITKSVERALLLIPEVVGNMMANQAALMKVNKAFYEKYPEFKDKKSVVASIVEEIDGKHTFEDYDKKLEKAVPKIRERIMTLSKLDMTKTSKPNLTFNGDI